MRLAVATALLLVLATPSRAQPTGDPTAQAKALYETGVLKYNVGDFANALESFKAAYQLHPDPALLFNIGQSHRLLGHTQDAIYAYRAYLRELPDALNRDEVERLRADLEQQLAQRKAATTTAVPATTTATTTAPAPAEPLIVATAPAAPPRPHIYQRWWLWTIVGVAIVGVAVGVGVAAGTRGPDAANPGGSAGSMVVHF